MEVRSTDIASGEKRLMIDLAGVRKTAADCLTRPIVLVLARTSVTPNALTWFGFLLSGVAAALIITEHLFAAGFLVLFAGLFDMLDGALARHTKQITRFGGFLDSIIDRLAEAALLVGVIIVYAAEQSFVGVLLAGIALPSSMLVSYIRARAEAAGLECKVGLFTRAERVVVLALGLLLSQIDYALIFAVGIIVVLSFVTIGQRFIHVYRQMKND